MSEKRTINIMQKQRVMLSSTLRGTSNKEEAAVLLPKLTSMLEQTGKEEYYFTRKKASNLKILNC